MFEYDEGLLNELREIYNDSISDVLESLTRPPPRYYVRVNVLRVSPDVVLDMLRGEGYSVYRDEYLSEALWFPVEGPNGLPEDVDCRVFVDKRTAESILLGANLYAPGVVEAEPCARQRGREVQIVFSGTELPVAVGVVEDPTSLERGRGLYARIVVSRFRAPSLRDTRYYREGLIYEQSWSSMLVTHVLDPRPGEVVIDMCAAPGGKTSHIYEYSGGRARILAYDHSRTKIEKMRSELNRLGHKDIVVERLDSRNLDMVLGRNVADKILLDPPCSSLGVRPKVYDHKTYKMVQDVARYQRQFIRTAWNLLKPCGVLVYSTCTLTIAENEENIRYATKLGFIVGQLAMPRTSQGLVQGTLRVHPHIHETTGYYIALLYKPCSKS